MSENQGRGHRRPHGTLDESLGRPGSSTDEKRDEPRAKVFKGQSEASTSGQSSGGVVAREPSHESSRREGGPVQERQHLDSYDIVRTRPADIVSKQGKEGEPISLQSNFFRLQTKPEWRIVHYHVDFEPELENIRVRMGILSNHANILGAGYLFDGKQLFTHKKLEKDSIVLCGQSKMGTDYKISIKCVGIVSNAEPRFLQVLNLILRRSMKGLKLELVGRNLFDPHAKIPIRDHQMELWPGYETSIRQHEKDIMLCAEITHKVMRTETVYEILKRCSNNPSRHQDEFRANVLDLVVLTDYNNKTYRINDVDFAQSPKSTFSCKGKDVSFIEYYLTKYNIRIRDHNQPLLISKNKDKAQKINASEVVVLIPELCRVTGLTESMRSNFQLMRAISDYTRMNPDRRIDRLRRFNNRLQNTADSVKVLNDWNMKLDENLINVQGRIIAPQKIVFNQSKCSSGESADWTRCFRDQRLLTTPSEGIDRWAVITPERNSFDLKTLLDSLFRAASGMGLKIRSPHVIKIQDDRTGSYVRAMDSCADMDPKLILCLVPNNNVERYSSIKKRGCVDRAVPTQVVTIKTSKNRGLLSIATKIAIQLNCKLGYTPWMIELPLSGLMTIGFDIAKSARDRRKAYGALVASMDLQQNSTYFSTVSECSAFDVLANNLWPMMAKALRQYQREHQKLPTRILFYRDGVSSGSLKQLFEYEVKDIVEKLDIEYKRANSGPPMLAYIVVTKSSNTRFFRNGRNPPPGTVVDNIVTLPERYDFYLVSQAGRQGTVSPTGYNVLYSNIRLSPDQIQKLTYKMCHLYYNWSGTTRVPAVCQYAKKLATFVGTHLHSIPQNALEKKFYYL
ncbi:protein piwi isoform X1 [Drosophila pseudoobscura]|uniref:Protein piwi isoform X1 n=1 Tax=Drosophila pseudoobscura pseudoobscura TaxID=46245 RepID=A0A6I8UAD1_DROPS|nr:protein piwi isoform X1 [Drosophila pseudoobscura]